MKFPHETYLNHIFGVGSVLEVTFGVDDTTEDTNVESQEVDEAVLVVAADKHAKIGDQDVLEEKSFMNMLPRT